MTREHTTEERARAIGLGLAQGALGASKATGIPRRTISRWLAEPAGTLDVLSVKTRTQVAEEFWSGVVEGIAAVRAGLKDPKARLGDKANSLRILVESHALITGGPTARTEAYNVNVDATPQLTWEEQNALADSLEIVKSLADASDDDLQTWLEDGGLATLRTIEQGGRAPEASDVG